MALNAGGRAAPARRSLIAPRPKLLLKLATAAVTIVFTYIALNGVDFATAWKALRSADLWWLIPTFVTFVVATAMRALRWHSLFAAGRRPSRAAVADAMIVGYLYNTIMPLRAGEAARTVVLTQRSAVPPVETIGTVVLERLYDVVAILIIFFAAAPWVPQVSWFDTAAVLAAVLAAIIVAAAAVLAIWGDRPLRVVLRPFRRLPFLSGERFETTIAELTHGLSGLRHGGLAFIAMLWTLGAWLVSALSAWLLSRAFPLHLPLSSGVLLVVAVGLSQILPAPPAGVGVFEGAVLIALKPYGISKSVGLPYAVLLHLMNLVPFLVAGALVIRYNARHPWRAPGAPNPPEARGSAPILS